MKEENRIMFCWVSLGLSYILLWLVVLFGIWGGNPRGVYWEVQELTGLKEVQDLYIEIMRTQINQLGEEILWKKK